jgi:hypothetical protein
MGELKAFLDTLGGLSPLAVIGLLGVIILLQVRQRTQGAETQAKAVEISDNHLSGLPEMAATLGRIESCLSDVRDNTVHIKARLNGGVK